MAFFISLLVLSFLVFFHELGHFLVAKFFGVRVEVFSIGFGQKIFKKTFGQTQYAISIIPLGGYIKMKGQEDLNPTKTSQDLDSYSVKHPLKRLAILFAGPFANFLVAFFIYFFICLNAFTFLLPIVGSVIPNSPAQIAGLKQGDLILKVQEQKIIRWSDVSSAIKKTTSEEISFLIKRDEQVITISIKPKLLPTQTIFNETIYKKMVGVSPNGESATIKLGVLNSFKEAFIQTKDASKFIFMGLVKILEGVVGMENIGGIISIVDLTSKASNMGLITLGLFTALISVNLGVLNLLPIPALDGGHIVFVVYELIFKKSLSEKALYVLTVFGWSILLGLMFLGVYNDLNRLVFNH